MARPGPEDPARATKNKGRRNFEEKAGDMEAGQFAGATIVMPGAGTGAGAQMTKNAEIEHDANSCRTRALHAGLESESLPGACTLL